MKAKAVAKLIRQQDIRIIDIFKDHWDRFLIEKGDKIPEEMKASVCEAVEKAIKCGDPRYGYAEYICIHCNGKEKKKIAFTCKSRFCNRCGKVYIDQWVEKQAERIIEAGHRHVIFSIPEELRIIFYHNRGWLKDLSDNAASVIQYWYHEKAKKRGYQVGIIAVVHTFGRDLKFNPHIHALITEGAIDKDKQWKEAGYIPYEYLRKAWQKVLMDWLKEKYPNNFKIKRLINDLYKRYKQGFYVHAERRMKDARGAARYIGRYLARPALAEYRILNYDGEKVHFWYEDHQTGKPVEVELDVIDFIGRLTYHIPKKHFKMVRRYGLYRRDLNKLAQKIVQLWNWINKKTQQIKTPFSPRKKSWKERIQEAFGSNPLKCPRCGREMELWTIWHPKYGVIWDFLKDGVITIEKKEETNQEDQAQKGRGRFDTIGNAGMGFSDRRTGRRPVQLSLPGVQL